MDYALRRARLSARSEGGMKRLCRVTSILFVCAADTLAGEREYEEC